MFQFLSFRELIAQLQAEQDARAQAIADEGSQSTLIIRTGDDVTGGTEFGGGVITVTQDGDQAVVEGDVPEDANLEVAVGGEPVEPVVEEVAAPEVAAEEPAPSGDQNIITVTQNGDEAVIEGDIPENATLEVAVGDEANIDPDGPNVVIEAVTEQIDNTPPAPTGVVLEGGDDTDFLTGTAGDDILNGNGGRDVLRGGEGNDVLSGGAGRDRLDGFVGDDTFIFNTGDGDDTIANFELLGDDDTIQLGVDGIDSLEDFLATQSAEFTSGQAITAVFDFGGGDSLTITLDSVDSLTADDFVFV